jgi:glyoxylase-like metal-dependent hydrolase (beta-lactamase superfamily II)
MTITRPMTSGILGAAALSVLASFAAQSVSGQQASNRASAAPQDAPATPGSFPAAWVHGSSNCTTLPEPPIQVHAYKPDTYILRQSKCLNFEGPFMHLLLGQQKALLIDTGATSSATLFPLQATVQPLIDAYEAQHGLPNLQLIVAHSHSHGDHVQGDGQFVGKPNTTVVGTSLSAVQAFFGIVNWPTDMVQYDLGGRIVDVIPAPGHQTTHVVYYDRHQDLLLTGDTLYPGFLFISNQSAYRASIDRVANFAQQNPITYVLGAHVEMTSTPGVAYPYGTAYQPFEHVLQLQVEHLFELQAALHAMPGAIVFEVHDDFVIDP